MKVGDIIVNPWVSREFDGKYNPMYATIYIGNNQSIDCKGRKHTWVDKVYRTDNEREWKVIGHCEILKYINMSIIDAVYGADDEHK